MFGEPRYVVKKYITYFAVYDNSIKQFICDVANQYSYSRVYTTIFLTSDPVQNICDILNKDATLYDEAIINYLNKDDNQSK